MSKRPNFILIITDQHRASDLGCYGHPVLKTPNIDALAEKGTRFDRFYVASPVCMPNRASLMTGRMPSLHGVRSNGVPLNTNNVTFVELLRDAGYDTALVGKSHLQNFVAIPPALEIDKPNGEFFQPAEHLSQAVRDHLAGAEYQLEGPDFWSQEQPQLPLPFYGFEQVELVTGHGDAVGGDYAAWLNARNPNAGDLLGPANQLPHDYECPQAVRTALPADLYSTSYIAEQAEAFINQRQSGDKPFFLMVSFPDPHHPFNPPGDYWDLYRPEQMPIPEAYQREDWVPPPHVQSVFDARANGKAMLKGMNSIGVSLRESQEAQALTCGMIAMVDDAVGRITSALAQAGIEEDTVLIFTSDHGDHLGGHRLLLKGAEQYQDIIRVPFIWSDPRAKVRQTNELGSTLDISATILHRAGIQPYHGIQGQTLVPIVEASGPSGRSEAFIQFDHQRTHPGLGGPPRVHSIVNDRWRLSIFHGVSWGELYDLENDPGEFRNLWGDPEYQTQKAQLIERLARAEIDSMDRVPLPTSLA